MNDSLELNTRWRTCKSIALELDAVLSVLGGSLFKRDSGPLREFSPFIESIPPDWLEELETLMRSAGGCHSVIENLAVLADVLFDEDYARASRAMRSLTPAAALARVRGLSAGRVMPAPGQIETADLLVEEFVQLQLRLYRESGVSVNRKFRDTLRKGIRFSLRLLPEGDLHERFWSWLDRFVEEKYAPWRLSRAEVMRNGENMAASASAAAETPGRPLDLTWLPEQNPVLRHPGLKSAVESGALRLCLWIEPIGLPDSWLLAPGMVISSFARAEGMLDEFRTYAASLAGRAAALSDPTRLIILRLIRNIDMTNTDMAEYLNLSRPTVSIHARILREAGLIRSHPEGRAVRHEIETEEVRRLFKDLATFLDLPEEQK